ncbi:MAG: hypothetical protein J6V93_02220 [Clostridia bacterium]|nr:hypothetical protein [Clostridia bacterium]
MRGAFGVKSPFFVVFIFMGALFEKKLPHTPAKTFKKWDLEIRALLHYTLNAFIFRDRYPENEHFCEIDRSNGTTLAGKHPQAQRAVRSTNRQKAREVYENFKSRAHTPISHQIWYFKQFPPKTYFI